MELIRVPWHCLGTWEFVARGGGQVRASLWQPVQISCMAFGPSRLAVGRENGSLELWVPWQ